MDMPSSPRGSFSWTDSPMRLSDKSEPTGGRQQNVVRFHDQQNRQPQRNYVHEFSLDSDLIMSDTEPEFYHAALFSPQAALLQQKFRVLGPVGLTGLAFFMSCGGPIGSEPLASAGGPLIGLIAVVVYVSTCVFPFLFVVAELCTTFPENGGYTVWVMTAFGPFWGFQAGYWSWVACALNNAIYPGLMYTTFFDACGLQFSNVAAYFIKASITIGLCMPSLLSVRFVAGAAFVLLIVISVVFLLFSTWGFASDTLDWSTLLDIRNAATINSILRAEANVTAQHSFSPGIDWGLLMNTLFWNFDGLFDASIISGEVLHPTTAYPRVFIINVAVMLALYVTPLVSAITATSDRFSWLRYNENSYPLIARIMGGTPLHTLITFSSVLSLVGLFTTSIMFQSFQVLGMAHMRLLPAAFRTRHKTYQTPQYAVFLGMLTTMVLLLFDYKSILGLTNAFSAGNQVLIVLTMLRLRQALPHITRPTKVPGPFPVVCAVLLPISGVFLYILFTNLMDGKAALAFAGLVIPGIAYGIVQRQHVHRELQQRALQRQHDLLVQVHPPMMP